MTKYAQHKLIIGTALLFFSYSAAQTYVPVIFARTGKTWLGILALLLIYGFMALTSAFSGKIIARIGPAALLRVTPFGYLFFLVAIVSQNAALVIVASAILGLCAGLFWTANTVYLLAQTTPQRRGRANGLLWSLQAACSVLGIWTFGVLLRSHGLGAAALSVGLVGLVGTAFLCMLPRAHAPPIEHTRPIAILRTRAYRRLLYLASTVAFLQGCAITLIPLLADSLGAETLVSTLGAIAYSIPAALALGSGFFLDRWGVRRTTVVLVVLASTAAALLFVANAPATLIIAGIAMSAAVGVFQPLMGTYPGTVPEKDRASLSGVIWTARAAGITLCFSVLLLTKTPFVYIVSALAIIASAALLLTEKTLFTQAHRTRT